MRHIITFSPRGPATFWNVHMDVTGRPLLFLDEGEAKVLRLDMTGYLDTSETISSVATTADDVTVTAATTSPYIDLTMSSAGDSGKVVVTATLSSGAKWRGTIYARPTKPYGEEYLGDYA